MHELCEENYIICRHQKPFIGNEKYFGKELFRFT